ncbi:response regulator [Massilia sp. PAMC28688]|uniref:two-component regulator propeller domain-containing protein n=1 Tax=Massilia sp. PAMC28688 TaxID=2861283 RepID=UPI001C62B2CB|nr:two-component regulator propeller domain-containing protein [Massilia sp. PAMC28688]QYF94021.1 response regulator [Massilia sp. PAMC28688]
MTYYDLIKRRWRATALLLLCCLPLLATAGGPARTLRFEHLSVDQGLAQESVLAVVQDADGFMWFGTQGGLSRFDGYGFRNFRNLPADPRSLVNNWVRVLHVDRRGRMWIGTDGGLDLYHPLTQTFTHYSPSQRERRGNGARRIRTIVEDARGGLWLGTGDGLQHFDPATGKFRTWHHVPGEEGSLRDDQIGALALDAGGRLWIGTNGGLHSLAPGATRFDYHPSPGADPKSDSIVSLLVDERQTLWIGSLAALDTIALGKQGMPGQRQRLGAAEGVGGGWSTALYQDSEGRLWMGSSTQGLYLWDPAARRFSNYRHLTGDKRSVGDNQVSSLYRDRLGTFWVGTWYAGVSRVDLSSGGFARVVRQSTPPHTLVDNKVRALLDAGDGKLWAGSNEGLSHLDPATGAARFYRHDPRDPRTLVGLSATALARDRQGVLWVGSDNGLTRFDPASGAMQRRVLAGGDPDSNNVRGMLCDRSGMLWLATRGGVHRLDPQSGAVTTYRHNPVDPASLSDDIARPILEDRLGQLWIGTFDGLEKLDRATGKFTHYRHNARDPASLSHDEVHYLLEDRRGTLWVGTAGGLNRMDHDAGPRSRFKRYTVRDGLADEGVAAILQDERERLWVSTNAGISRLDPATGQWRNYSAVDGMIEGAYFDGSAVRLADGTMYFGGFNGITAFHPDAIVDNLAAPRVAITGFQIFNKPVEQYRPGMLAAPVDKTRALTLRAEDSVFSFEFAALHYAAPQRNRFAYRLEGFDENWVSTDAGRRFATYTNLDPGHYTFRVKAANKDGIWSSDSASIEVEILPPWWKTLWFRAAVALLVLGSAWLVYRARLSGLRRQKALLERQVRARTLEIEEQNKLLERQKGELESRRSEAERQRYEAEQRRSEAERQRYEVELQKEQVEQAHRNISVLSGIGRELTATLDMETIMLAVYRHVHHLMDARIFGIGFYDEEAGLIRFPFAMDQGVRSQYYERSLEDRNQFAVWCFHERREVFINDMDADWTRYLPQPPSPPPAPPFRVDGEPRSRPRSTMYVPLIVKERMMGVLCVQSVERNAYRQVHLDMLQTLAAHAAVALDNARAYRELEETQARLMEQERQVRQNTEQLAEANRALQENDERLRLAKQKAEDATRQKSEFLANMSHEMRTPLAGVIGMLRFALRDARLHENTREQILRGQANAQALLTIINDLLDFSKIEAGKLTIENIDFALAPMLANVGTLFEEQAAARSVGFRIVLGQSLPQFVVGDPTRLRQVLVNLLGNAFKFTHAGAVRLDVTLLEPGPDTAPGVNLISFCVSDSGIGIAPDALERLFQKFEQADSTTTRRYGGTGLGLAICRQLVQLMGGTISVRSEVGQGSAFTVVLPMADGVAPPMQPPAQLAPHSHRLHVLCAEDFPTNQIIIRMMLEELGHQVDIADNGALAVAACALNRYDLILMDGRMPEMDGASATRLIRSGGPAERPVLDRDLMIIALTANASEEDRQRYIDSGMDDFLSKPIDETALHRHLSRAIERQLARGVALRPLARRAPRTPSTSELDAMFGVAAAPPTATPPHQYARRSSDLRTRMRAAFASDVPARRADLERAVLARDSAEAGRLLHGIKGSAAYLEARELHALCGALELAADRGHWQEVEAGLPRVRELLDHFSVTTPGQA